MTAEKLIYTFYLTHPIWQCRKNHFTYQFTTIHSLFYSLKNFLVTITVIPLVHMIHALMTHISQVGIRFSLLPVH